MLVALLALLHEDPLDTVTWKAAADWFEEQGDATRADLVRLTRVERQPAVESRITELLAGGVEPLVPELVNHIGMRLALIPPGIFLMGSPPDEPRRSEREGPQHEVEITRPFYLGVFPVTQGQYQEVMGANPSWFSQEGDGRHNVAGLDTTNFPVECVSHRDARAFCKKLNETCRIMPKGWKYRLPTEAEWEYACRAGASSPTAFSFGDSLSGAQANFDGRFPFGDSKEHNQLARTCAVGSYTPNAWGLHDMHGNVQEWCADWFDDEYSSASPRCDPKGPARNWERLRVIRGGSWLDPGFHCRSAYRSANIPSCRTFNIGFRVAWVQTS